MYLKRHFGENFKKIGFLAGMMLICYSLLLLREAVIDKESYITSVQSNPSEIDSLGFVAQSSFYNTPPSISPFEEIEFIGDNVVMGASVGGAGDGCRTENRQGCISKSHPPQPICASKEVSVDMAGGTESGGGASVTVTKDTVIEIWKITSPMGLLSGVEHMSNNTYPISNEFGEYSFPSSSGLIRERVGTQSVAPDSTLKRTITVEIPQDQYKIGDPFSVNAGLDGVQKNQATVEKSLSSALPEKVQPSDPNPGRTNAIAKEITGFYTPPGTPLGSRDYPNTACIDLSDVRHLPKQDVWETCVNRRSPFSFSFRGVFDTVSWNQCKVDAEQTGSSSCKDIEVVGLFIDAIFGSSWTCEEGFCAKQYFDYSMAANISPMEYTDFAEEGFESNPEPVMRGVYITTPCAIRVDRREVVKIPCVWDISPYMALHHSESLLRTPADKSWPDWDEYFEVVIDQAEARGAVCGF